MIQVPIHGMENNADSLVGRRKAFLKAYGYGPEDVERYEELTELIGHVPTMPKQQDVLDFPLFENYGPKIRLTLFSTVTPYTTAWVTVDTENTLPEIDDYEQSGLWIVSKVERISSGK